MIKKGIPMQFDVTFNDLLTAVLESGKANYITNLPDILLKTEYEKNAKQFLLECSAKGFVPTVDRFKEKFNFYGGKNDLPIDILYESFGNKRQNEILFEQAQQTIDDNRKNDLDPLTGFMEAIERAQAMIRLPNPAVVSTKTYSRSLYNVDTWRGSFGIPYFDNFTTGPDNYGKPYVVGGLNGGDFHVLLAPTKSFKTTLLKLITQAAFDNGSNVVFASQEQAPDKMLQQLDMQRLGKSHSSLRQGVSEELMQELLKIQELDKNREQQILITPKISTVGELDGYVKQFAEIPRIIIIDGINLMGIDYNNSYGSLAQVSAELKSYANQHNVAIVACTQTNRTGVNADKLSGQHIAASFAIAMYADTVIGLAPNHVEKYVYIHSVYNRHGGDDVKILFRPKYTKDGKFKPSFALVPPEWEPDASNVSFAERGSLEMKQLLGKGMTFEEIIERQEKIDAEGNVSEEF